MLALSHRAPYCIWAICPRNCSSKGSPAHRAAAIATEDEGGTEAVQVKALADLEREAILGAIRTLNGDKLQAAKLLGIGKTTLYRKLKEYGITDMPADE